jgi:hypothetical protein
LADTAWAVLLNWMNALVESRVERRADAETGQMHVEALIPIGKRIRVN